MHLLLVGLVYILVVTWGTHKVHKHNGQCAQECVDSAALQCLWPDIKYAKDTYTPVLRLETHYTYIDSIVLKKLLCDF